MASLNKITVIGNLGSEPEMRFTPNGNAVTSFSLATNRVFTVDGERREDTQWFKVITWNKLGETCNQFLAKGRQVYVEGRLQTKEWEDKEGEKQFSAEITASTVLFLGTKADAPDDAVTPIEPAETNEPEPDEVPF